jgi:outer membrane protein assembly complex protein YaeT
LRTLVGLTEGAIMARAHISIVNSGQCTENKQESGILTRDHCSLILGEIVLKAKAARKSGKRSRRGILLACLLALGISSGSGVWGQNLVNNAGNTSKSDAPATPMSDVPATRISVISLAEWEGFPVKRISFVGVSADRLVPLAGHLDQAEGAPLGREELKRSLRQLFATGLYETIAVEGVREQDGVALTFRGTPRTFIGTVSVDGARSDTVNTQLERASQLAPGARFTPVKLTQAVQQMRAALAQDGFYEPVITHTVTAHPEEQLVDITFHVVSGPQARVGTVEVSGEPGMSESDFRRHARLRAGERVDRETGNRALAGVLKAYRGEQRLEAEIKLESQQFSTESQRVDFRFSANRGPEVKVLVEGASLSAERIKRVIPIFEEGSVDEDLLNEGNRRLRDYYQRMGYFDVKVEHERESTTAWLVTIRYKVRLGPRRRVERVSVAGNRYFDSATLKELLSVHAADALDRHGAYSQALVAADVNTLQTLYQNNGFYKARITPETNAAETKTGITAPLTVVYRIEEGEQLRVGAVRLEGNEHADAARLALLMNTVAGQLLSPQNLAGDRDALLIDYMSRGFDQVRVEVSQQIEPADASKVDVVFHITEGRQIFVRKVLLTGLHYTRPETVAKAITLHPGDPLNETALMDTQRNLYDFALFNEIDTAIENPSGEEVNKTVLLQATEARRWALTYGGGLEAQTGTPQYNCGGIKASGATCNPNGKVGVSPRVLADITRNNLFGREQSISLRGNYGLLEQKINLLFQNPHFEGNRNFGLTVSGGYANSLDVSTYVASKLETGVRWTQHFDARGFAFSRANTFIYEFDFRRVKVEADSLQVYPKEIAELSTAVRVAGPSLTWIRDTRDSPLDAHRGTYTSLQEFLSGEGFGAQANFYRLDLSNSSYYRFDKGRFVLARNTRYGQERTYGELKSELLPLPERLYAGGATSLRSFGVNQAGPRDPETGYPIGGAGALINSTELRLPPPTLPWLGNTVSFVLFHDMGNVFTNAGDAWASALRVRQPLRDDCKILIPASEKNANPVPTGPSTSTGVQGQCSFNYFSHAPGVGLRYHTPVGPIRFDFSYNLNPPIYPVNIDYSLYPANPIYSNPHVGEGTHFNFFFSLGQTF